MQTWTTLQTRCLVYSPGNAGLGRDGRGRRGPRGGLSRRRVEAGAAEAWKGSHGQDDLEKTPHSVGGLPP